MLITLHAALVSSDQDLIPGRSLNQQLLRFGSHVARYSLQHLKPNTGYEVRVSYPATVPSKVTLQLASAGFEAAPARHRRHLLDTEKIIFHTDDQGVYQGKRPVVEMQAEATGIHRDGPDARPEYFLYNIVLAELMLGIPTDALPVVLMVIIALVAVGMLLPWWVDKAVPAMLRFMAGGREGKQAAHVK